MMKIKELTVVDQGGVEHKFEGDGFCAITSEQEKPLGGGMAKIVGLSVEAKLVAPKEE